MTYKFAGCGFAGTWDDQDVSSRRNQPEIRRSNGGTRKRVMSMSNLNIAIATGSRSIDSVAVEPNSKHITRSRKEHYYD
jgi:hypothetical protein